MYKRIIILTSLLILPISTQAFSKNGRGLPVQSASPSVRDSNNPNIKTNCICWCKPTTTPSPSVSASRDEEIDYSSLTNIL